MNWLDLLKPEEKELWIKKYAYYKFNETEPKLPQAWNRIWALTNGFNIPNLNDLKKIKTINFQKAKKTICSYIPNIQDISEQNVFDEQKEVMLSKYITIRRFCNKSFFEELERIIKSTKNDFK